MVSAPSVAVDANCDLDECIEILLKCESLPLHQLKAVCEKVKEILVEEPTVVPLRTPLTLVGDIHGQFYDMEELFKIGGSLPDTNYLFLGDYVDRGYHSLEVVSLLLCYKARWPHRITLLRGNHESRSVNQVYGFYSECYKKYGKADAWNAVNMVFDYLPLAALIDNKIFCVHGGISPYTTTIDDVRTVDRYQDVPSEGAMADMLWSDPGEVNGFVQSMRGCGFQWGPDISKKFCSINKCDYIVRAHQCVMKGYEWNHDNKVATVFSAPNYMYRSGNKAALMILDSNRQQKFIAFDAAPRQQSEMSLGGSIRPMFFLLSIC